MRSSTAVGREDVRGRLTSIPRYIMGAVSMKMRRSTSTTSTSGMMLISARDVPIRRPSPGSSNLNAIFGGAQLGGAAEDVQQIEGEAVHLGGPVLHAVDEVVVADDGRDGRPEAGGGGDEGLRDAGRDDGEARRPLLADPVEGRHDPPHGAEETDERGGARGGGEEGKVALEPRHLEARGTTEGTVHHVQPVAGHAIVAFLDHALHGVGDPGEFLVAGGVEMSEGAFAKLLGRAVHRRGPTALPEDLEELEGLPAHTPELPPL